MTTLLPEHEAVILTMPLPTAAQAWPTPFKARLPPIQQVFAAKKCYAAGHVMPQGWRNNKQTARESENDDQSKMIELQKQTGR